MKLSVVIITYNEQDTLDACLNSVSFADEIVIIDGGSEDKTQEIGKRHGAKIYRVDTNDFSVKRNSGKDKSLGEWILYVDADERVSVELKNNILKTINSTSLKKAYKIKRKNFYLGKPWPKEELIERLFLKENLSHWEGRLHESPKVIGEIGIVEGELLHFTHRTLAKMIEKTNQWSEIEADLRIKAKHPKMSQWRFIRVMITVFFDNYVGKKGYKAGTVGVIESIYQSFSMFITYSKLWEKQRKYE